MSECFVFSNKSTWKIITIIHIQFARTYFVVGSPIDSLDFLLFITRSSMSSVVPLTRTCRRTSAARTTPSCSAGHSLPAGCGPASPGTRWSCGGAPGRPPAWSTAGSPTRRRPSAPPATPGRTAPGSGRGRRAWSHPASRTPTPGCRPCCGKGKCLFEVGVKLLNKPIFFNWK